MIEIRSPSRLHLSLIDMNAELGRVDGGAGITLESPGIILQAEIADSVEILGNSLLAERMQKAAKDVLPEGQGIRIHINQDMPSHVGLGCGTQAALSAASAVNELYGLGKSVRELAIAVGRGGTSGIGVAAFENGGFIVDGGHRFNTEKKSFSPSSASHVPPGPVLFRRDFPDWPIVLAIPDSKGAHDKEEVDIFRKVCPIPLPEVQEVSHVVLMQMLPAILEEDLDSFGAALNHLQRVGFKKREVELQPTALDLAGFMLENGAAGSGLSSFGPAVYGIVGSIREGQKLKADVQKLLDESLGGRAYLTNAKNTGAEILGGQD